MVVALNASDELKKLGGRSLFDEEARQRDALRIVEAPVRFLGVVHGEEILDAKEPALGDQAFEVGGANLLFARRLGEDSHALVGPAGDLLAREQVGQDDVRYFMRQDRVHKSRMIDPQVDAPGDDPAVLESHRREAR